MESENYPVHRETFDVVLLKEGVSDLSAKPGDFKRVTVTASGPLQAQMDDSVAKEKGYRVLFAAPPGVMTDPEIQAQRRELELGVEDKSKV